MPTVVRTAGGNSGAEDRFIELFCDAFGAEKGQFVYLQYPMADIYGGHRKAASRYCIKRMDKGSLYRAPGSSV